MDSVKITENRFIGLNDLASDVYRVDVNFVTKEAVVNIKTHGNNYAANIVEAYRRQKPVIEQNFEMIVDFGLNNCVHHIANKQVDFEALKTFLIQVIETHRIVDESKCFIKLTKIEFLHLIDLESEKIKLQKYRSNLLQNKPASKPRLKILPKESVNEKFEIEKLTQVLVEWRNRDLSELSQFVSKIKADYQYKIEDLEQTYYLARKMTRAEFLTLENLGVKFNNSRRKSELENIEVFNEIGSDQNEAV